LIAGQGELLVRRSAGEGDRPPDDHPLGQPGQVLARVLAQLQQKSREQVLELITAADDLGLGEALGSREALE